MRSSVASAFFGSSCISSWARAEDGGVFVLFVRRVELRERGLALVGRFNAAQNAATPCAFLAWRVAQITIAVASSVSTAGS